MQHKTCCFFLSLHRKAELSILFWTCQWTFAFIKRRLSWLPVFPAYFQTSLLFGKLLAASPAHARFRIPEWCAGHIQVYVDSIPTNFSGSNFCCSRIYLWLGLFRFSSPADLYFSGAEISISLVAHLSHWTPSLFAVSCQGFGIENGV